MSKKYRSGNRQTKKCLRCGYEWLSELDEPTACPRCQSHYWNTPRINACGAPRKIPYLGEPQPQPKKVQMVIKHGIELPISDLTLLEQIATRAGMATGQRWDKDKLTQRINAWLELMLESKLLQDKRQLVMMEVERP